MKTRYLLPILLLCPGLLAAEGWTTYRADSARSGYTAEELPGSSLCNGPTGLMCLTPPGRAPAGKSLTAPSIP